MPHVSRFTTLLMLKLLFLTPQLPYPPRQGTSLRNYHIICGLAQRHEITLLSFLEAGQTADPAAIAPLLQLCTRVQTTPAPRRRAGQRLRQLLTTRLPDMAHRLYSPAFNAQLEQLLRQHRFDVVQIEGIELARAIEIIRAAGVNSKIVFDNHNAETELQRRNFLTDLRIPRRWPAAVYSWIQMRRLRRFEGWACSRADWVTAVSEADASQLRKLLNGTQINADERKLNTPYAVHYTPVPISTIPNCIDVRAYETPPDHDLPCYDLLFSGKMDYRPNVDAVLWFADEVWPLIQRERPLTTWAIVGQKPHRRLARLQELPGVTITGWVEDVRPYLHGAAVFIMPFRIGSGTRLKLIEAMAAGKAIVSTSLGVEGFDVKHGRELLLADQAEAMATAVLYLLNQPQARQTLAETARKFAPQYDWRVVVPRFDKIYEQLCNENNPHLFG